MNKSFILAIAAIGSCFASANAQETVEYTSETITITEQECGTRYYAPKTSNWFLQIGAGVSVPFVEYYNANVLDGKEKHHFTAAYSVGFGKWFTPYLGFRTSFIGGSLHWDSINFCKAKYVTGNVDLMWDMFNTFGGVNPSRVFSIVPFVGVGGSFQWDFKGQGENIIDNDQKKKSNQWTLPVSAGLQLRFRLSRYVDFFAEGRANFHGDNFNNTAWGEPVDVNITAIGGFSFNLGGVNFKSYNPCDYTDYINSLNGQVNDLRAALVASNAALAAAEAQLPCPEVVEQVTVVEAAPLMSTVRFTINSARIRNTEKVNVYNIAKWMKENPGQNVAIVGYADANTGTSDYNLKLSKRRAQAVYDMLVNEYGINADRLTMNAEGSSVQPYDENNWNRIVIFSVNR